MLAALAWLVLGACTPGLAGPRAAPIPPVLEAVATSCAWFGDSRDGVLYFGESPFWSVTEDAGGDARAAAALRVPHVLGRFDLARRALLPPLRAVGRGSGTWDVLAHPNGRVYYSDLFADSGWVDPRSGRSRPLADAGAGLNELALGPDGALLATRYAPADGGPGSWLAMDEAGHVEAEHPLVSTPEALRPAAKSLAFDPVRRVVWVNTDLFDAAGRAGGHDTRVLEFTSGRELLRIAAPELQFVRFSWDGSGRFAWLEGERLVLRTTAPGAARDAHSGRALLLDPAFPVGHDFVQEIRTTPDGSTLVTRWSGLVHRVAPDGALRTLRLPRPDPGGLYYTAVAADGGLCATFCGATPTVVCTEGTGAR